MGFLNPIPAAGWGTAGSGSAPAPAEYGFRSPFLFAFGMAGNNTTVEAVVAPAATGGGRRPKRRRYLLPDDVLVVATEDEILEILRAMEPEEVVQKPQQSKAIRAKGKHSPEIKKRTLKSGVVKITIPQTWAPDPNIYPILIKKLQEREEEEIVIMLATIH